MTNAELIKALRWCPSHGCGRCVALDANGRCTLHGVVGLMSQAADLIEAQAKRIEELEAQLPKEGKWYIDEEGNVRCTACKTKCLRDDIGINILSNYCPSCGARMNGGRE